MPLLRFFDILRDDYSANLENTLMKEKMHPRIFHRLLIFPISVETTLEKPVSYTDPEQMMEDVTQARLDEELPPLRQTLEERIPTLNNPLI